MSKIAIKAENISKQYRLGEIGTGTISHDLNRWWHSIRGKDDPFLKIGDSNNRSQKGESDYVWSLKDINFEINKGDAVGIIGRNGAGKSTLLKLISKVTKPTTGQFKVNGRIASLLEVGTGFHPEMTGRENIYLNGAILGMRRSEITRKFDEIVDFAGIERYIDTPVKRYSSGMYVRLAFAVAAHLESEILIVDEVLAVGDAEFQKKCLGKMGEVSNGEGRTVLFVSHNISAIQQLCNTGLLLEKGNIVDYSNNLSDIFNLYLHDSSNKIVSDWKNIELKYNSPYFLLHRLYLTNSQNKLIDREVLNNEQCFLNFEFEINQLDDALQISFEVYNENGILIYCSQNTDSTTENWPKLQLGFNKLTVPLPTRLLNQGSYLFKPGACLHNTLSLLEPTKHNISLKLNILGGLSDSPLWFNPRGGVVAPVLQWFNRN